MEAGFERLVPVELWIEENIGMASIWRSGSPRLTGPENLRSWLRRHEMRLTERRAVIRIRNAWRIIEPTFRPVMLEILGEERDAAARKRGWRKP